MASDYEKKQEALKKRFPRYYAVGEAASAAVRKIARYEEWKSGGHMRVGPKFQDHARVIIFDGKSERNPDDGESLIIESVLQEMMPAINALIIARLEAERDAAVLDIEQLLVPKE